MTTANTTNTISSQGIDKFSVSASNTGSTPLIKIDSIDPKTTIVVANFGADGKTITGVGYVYKYDQNEGYKQIPFNAGDSISQEALKNPTFIFNHKGEPVGQTLQNIGNNDSIISNGQRLVNNPIQPVLDSTLTQSNNNNLTNFLSNKEIPNGASFSFKANNDIKIGDTTYVGGSSIRIIKDKDGYSAYTDTNKDNKIDASDAGKKLSQADVDNLSKANSNINISQKIENTNIDLTTTKDTNGNATGVSLNTNSLQLEDKETLIIHNPDGTAVKYTGNDNGGYTKTDLTADQVKTETGNATFEYNTKGEPIGNTAKNIEDASQNANGIGDKVTVDGKAQEKAMDWTSLIVTCVLLVFTVFIILIFYYNAKSREQKGNANAAGGAKANTATASGTMTNSTSTNTAQGNAINANNANAAGGATVNAINANQVNANQSQNHQAQNNAINANNGNPNKTNSNELNNINKLVDGSKGKTEQFGQKKEMNHDNAKSNLETVSHNKNKEGSNILP
jgi:hypothetical protein